MNKWLWGLLIIVVLFVVAYYSGVIRFNQSANATKNSTVTHEADTESDHDHSH